MSNAETDKGDLQKQLTMGMASEQVVQPFIISALEEANGGPPAKVPHGVEATIKVDDQGSASLHTKYDTGKGVSLEADTTVDHTANGNYYTRDAETGDIIRKENLVLALMQPNQVMGFSTFNYPKTGKTYEDLALMDLSPTSADSQNMAGTSHEIFRRDGKILGYVDSTISTTGALDGRTEIMYQIKDTQNKLLRTLKTVEDDQGLQAKIKLEQV
jgi:hypothetical protein